VARSTPYADCSDEELLDLFRQGASEAFGALVRRYEGELFGYLRRYLGDSDLADDVFQTTFLQVYTKADQYESGRPVRPWLYAVATNQAVDALRRDKRHRILRLHGDGSENGDAESSQLHAVPDTRSLGPVEHLQAEERKELIRAAVDKLPEFLRSVVILAYYQGLKYKDIATILGVPVGTVKSRLHTALGKLHEAWSTEPVWTD